MELKVSKDSNLTIHLQLKEQIKGLILDGALAEDVQLPTVRQLGEFLQINKNTVSKVYKDLEQEGYVNSLKGKGTFVSYHKDKSKIEFLKAIEDVLKSGIEDGGIDYKEILGMVYFKSHHLRFLSLKGKINKMAILECNTDSIDDFKRLVYKNIPVGVEVVGVLLDELVNDFENTYEKLKDIEFIAIPYIHYNEVDKELKKLGKEIFTFGISQSLRLLNYGKKMKSKHVGIIGYSELEEDIILRQFERVNVKSFIKYNGIEEKGLEDLKQFLRNIDFLIIASNVYDQIKDKIKPKKNYIVFEGQYAIDDMKVIKEIFQ